jgi:membrane-bound ClpP family serine protease
LSKALLGIYGILLLVWATMLILLLVAGRFIVPLELPVPGSFGTVLSSIIRTILGIALALAWLYGWKKLYEAYFWRLIEALERQKER